MILSTIGISDSVPTIIDGAYFWYDPGNESSYSGSGINLANLTGVTRNATISGSPSYTSGQGGYFSFDGSNDYILSPNILDGANESHTVEVWIRPSANDDCIWQDIGQPTPDSGYHFSGAQINASGSNNLIRIGLWNGTGITAVTAGNSSYLEEWVQLVRTYDGTTVRSYINGVAGGSTSVSYDSPYNDGMSGWYLAFGAQDSATTIGGNTAGYFSGRYGTIRYYKFALSAGDIMKNYQATQSLYQSTKGTLENPGISAQEIYDSGQTASGWYYIQTSTMDQPRQVYCNMTDESGGWMLIGYTPSFNNTNGGLGLGLSYPNTWENGEGTFNRLRVDAMDLWFHDSSAQCTQVMKMATTTYNQVPLLDNVSIANKVVYDNPSNLLLSTVSNYPAFVNNTPMTGTWSPIKGHTLMSTSLSVNAPGDWIYQASVWWTVCGPSTQLTANGRSGNAQGTGSWTNPSTNNVYGMSNVATTTNSNRTDIQTYAVYIK